MATTVQVSKPAQFYGAPVLAPGQSVQASVDLREIAAHSKKMGIPFEFKDQQEYQGMKDKGYLFVFWHGRWRGVQTSKILRVND